MRISAFFVLAAYLAANAYVAARTSIFLHRNLPERVAKLSRFLVKITHFLLNSNSLFKLIIDCSSQIMSSIINSINKLK